MVYAEWNWQFFGFQWLNGNQPVQEWFAGLPEDAKDEARDTIGYLQHLPIVLWKRPRFDPLSGEEVSEIRFETATHTYRIYGHYWPFDQRQVYTFLHGTDKKRSHDAKGKREATSRKRDLEGRRATIHKFKFY